MRLPSRRLDGATGATERGDEMAMADRRAEATWAGEPHRGTDLVSSGVASSLPITWPNGAARRAHQSGRSCSPPRTPPATRWPSPRARHCREPLERLHVTAVVSLNPKEGGGVEVTDSALTVTGTVPGLDQAGFQEAAEAGEQGAPSRTRFGTTSPSR